MPIPPPVKAVLRKDLLLGGGAGALLCALVAGAALSVGSLFGFDWGSGDQPAATPATPAPVPAARGMRLSVANVAVTAAADGAPEVALGLSLDRGAASAPDQVTVRLRPQLPGHAGAAAANAPLALQANLDVI